MVVEEEKQQVQPQLEEEEDKMDDSRVWSRRERSVCSPFVPNNSGETGRSEDPLLFNRVGGSEQNRSGWKP